jgi:hypothetical protein
MSVHYRRSRCGFTHVGISHRTQKVNGPIRIAGEHVFCMPHLSIGRSSYKHYARTRILLYTIYENLSQIHLLQLFSEIRPLVPLSEDDPASELNDRSNERLSPHRHLRITAFQKETRCAKLHFQERIGLRLSCFSIQRYRPAGKRYYSQSTLSKVRNDGSA